MRFILTTTAALLATTTLAHAFTFEGPPPVSAGGGKSAPPSGFVDINPASVLPPTGEPLPSMRFNEGPGARNNGWASPPSRRDSVGPGWLYDAR